MSVIYIAVPSKGATSPAGLYNGLTSGFVKAMAKLRQKYPQHAFISPMLQDYQMLSLLEEEPTWENWKNQCEQLIKASEEVWVLMFNGWSKPVLVADDVYNTSVGVGAEIQIAYKAEIPVSFFDP